MLNCNFFLTICFLLLSSFCHGQKEYFQQQVDTYIEVKLDDKNNFLHGNEKIVYKNNSLNSLDSIVIHLWPNAYKNIDTELAKQKLEDGQTYIKYAPSNKRGYIDSLDFNVDNQKIKWQIQEQNIDIATIYLNQSLKSGDSIIISTPFRVKIPSGRFSRLGHIGQSYQITQWFPKPAVYDNNGWHPLPYLNQGEFYSEFGKYDVSITLPENYVIMATGDLQTESEVSFLNNKAKQTKVQFEKGGIPIVDSLEIADMTFPKSSEKFKTVRFTQSKVHDFAWFADKRYHVLKGEVLLGESNRKVTTWALFTNKEAHLWEKSIEYLNDATLYFSKWVGEYPYSHVTAVDGTISAGGGMEYPNITVIGTSDNDYSLETVIVHEVGHNWFYGILGSNERDNAWMDEGLNTYIEIRYMEEKYGDKNIINSFIDGSKKIKLDLEHKNIHQLSYQFNASRNCDQPMQTSSSNFTTINYPGSVYSKTGIGFHYLKDYLGEKTFDECMNKYFEIWKFKHPEPKDIQEIFTQNCKVNLNWFFNDYINSTKKIDYRIKRIKKINENQYLVKLHNETGFEAPTVLNALEKNENKLTIIDEKWINGFSKDTSFIINTKTSPTHFVLDHEMKTTDFNFKHHLSKTNGIIKKVKPISFKVIPFNFTNNDTNHIYWVPLLGWNNYDKFMTGISLYNKGIKTKKTEWAISPFYSFRNKALNGFGEISHNIYTYNVFSQIKLGYAIKSFSNRLEYLPDYNNRWIKQEIFSTLRIKENKPRYTPIQRITLSGIRIDEQYHYTSPNSISPPEIVKETNVNYYAQLKYNITSKQILKPKSLEIKYIYGQNHNRNELLVSSLQVEANNRWNYNKNRDAIKIRFFGGYNFANIYPRYNLLMKGQDGYYDYLFERTYLARNSYYPTTFGNQTSITQGGFKTNSILGSSGDWLIASNLSMDIPKLPIGLFLDLGAYPSYFVNANTSDVIESTNILYSGGINFEIEANNKLVLGIYLPLFYSEEIANSYVTDDPISPYPNPNPIKIKDLNFLQRITFVFNINNINPFTLKKNIKP